MYCWSRGLAKGLRLFYSCFRYFCSFAQCGWDAVCWLNRSFLDFLLLYHLFNRKRESEPEIPWCRIVKSWSWGALGAVKKETCPGRKRWMRMGGLSVATLWVFFFECCFTLRPRWWLMLQGVLFYKICINRVNKLIHFLIQILIGQDDILTNECK